MVLEQLLDLKKSVVKIKKEDELLCTCHRHHESLGRCQRESPRPTLPQSQTRPSRPRKKAKKLHLDAGVPEGPCGRPEIETFQRHLIDYQIVVLSVDHNYEIVFKGPPQDKQIILIKVGEHYHGCNSLSGFLGRGYFCIKCETSFNTDDIKHHPCKGKKCHAFCETQCIDYHQSRGQEAGHTCPQCHRQFFGEQCLGNHYVYSTTDRKRADTAKKIKPVCVTICQCPICNRLLRPQEMKRATCAGPVNAPLASNIMISPNINVTSRILPD